MTVSRDSAGSTRPEVAILAAVAGGLALPALALGLTGYDGLAVAGAAVPALIGFALLARHRAVRTGFRRQARLIEILGSATLTPRVAVGADGRALWTNETFRARFAVAPDRVLDALESRLCGEEAARARFRRLREVAAAGAAASDEFSTRGPAGAVEVYSLDVRPVAGIEGATSWRISDRTPERDMAVALSRSEQSFRRFFEDAPVGIAHLDAGGRLVELNRVFERMTGLGRGEGAGRPVAELVREEDRAGLADRLRGVAGTSDGTPPAPIEVRLAGTAGTTVQLFATRLEPADEGGLILYVLDIAERKRLEAQFVQSQKMQAVGQLAGGIAHDFNNLLTAMIGFCDLLLLRHHAGDPSFGDIMQIKQNASRAANLVRQLLAFSRQQTLQPRLLNVTDELTELSHLLRRLIGSNIELKVVHGRDLDLVKVDQGQLEQVIINLAVNARDAMPDGGRLAIRTANVRLAEPAPYGADVLPPGEYVRIEVRDTGVGIAKENLGRIFEPFFSTKEVGSGTGLGLSTVYGIVKQTGGFVFVDSAPGQGATFSIYLPRWRDEAGAAPRRGRIGERHADLTGAGTVLLVEDEDAVRLFSARALRNKGYRVVEAQSGGAALDILDKFGGNIDLMVTDVVMPHMDGTTLIKVVRERRPQIKVICISGYAEESFRARLDKAEGVHFLPKPFNLDELAGKVKDVLR
ncbi:MAG: ATP-binding protein [Pseudomonadota bacterium]